MFTGKKPKTIDVELLMRVLNEGPEAIKASFAWVCPVCGESVQIKEMIEYEARPLKICDECLKRLKKMLYGDKTGAGA
jgi:hypothetical protein